MLKKMFALLTVFVLLLISGGNSASAIDLGDRKATVAVILDTPDGMFSEPEKVYATFQQSLDKIFANTSRYEFMSMDDTSSYVQMYREENDLVSNVETASGDVVVREQPLKKEDYGKICNHFNADYMIYARVTSSVPRVSGGFFSASQNVNVTMDFRIWEGAKNDFVYTKRTSTTGKSTTIYAGGFGSSTHAVEKGLKKGLQELEKDAAKINSAMID